MITLPGYKDIQEGLGELDAWKLLVAVLVEPGQFFHAMLSDDGVIHIVSPNRRLEWG